MNESKKPFSFILQMHNDGSSISVWDYMISPRVGPLVFYEDWLNSPIYIQIIGYLGKTSWWLATLTLNSIENL